MDIREAVRVKAQAAHDVAGALAVVPTEVKNRALLAMAEALVAEKTLILEANAKDMANAQAKGMKTSMQDRLKLTDARIEAMAEGLRQVAALTDPVGEVLSDKTLPNGLNVRKVRVPLGVVAMIYEARPNVTADAIGLALKTGNAVVLKGGSEALHSNEAIAGVLRDAAVSVGMPGKAVQFIDITDRQAVTELIRMNGLVDVAIPRGSARLIQAVLQTEE